MFRLENQGVVEESLADLVGNSAVELLVGRKPIGTCDDVREEDVHLATGHAHAIGSLGERLDHQILILLSPFAHPRVRVNNRDNILDDVFILPSFVVK